MCDDLVGGHIDYVERAAGVAGGINVATVGRHLDGACSSSDLAVLPARVLGGLGR